MKVKLHVHDHYKESDLPSSVEISIYSVSWGSGREYIGYYRYLDERASHWDGYEGYVWLDKGKFRARFLRESYRGKGSVPDDIFDQLGFHGSSIQRRFCIMDGADCRVWCGGLNESDIEEIYDRTFV
jgi:hypothetical protein